MRSTMFCFSENVPSGDSSGTNGSECGVALQYCAPHAHAMPFVAVAASRCHFSFANPHLDGTSLMPFRRIRWIAGVLCGAVAASISCMKATAAAAGAPTAAVTSGPPKLVVFITVDQLRGDMLDRYRHDLRYGYARLMRGAWFVNAFQDHAITETAPGHASTMSGRFPRSTGIASNATGVIPTRSGRRRSVSAERRSSTGCTPGTRELGRCPCRRRTARPFSQSDAQNRTSTGSPRTARSRRVRTIATRCQTG
ncbi:MAG: hypothetical protein E6H78_20740 [Betaproteobacteria bacterium]|nr:MAG: hypothetical protein E6H78_20740 [Betaproteobacteria bacterium]